MSQQRGSALVETVGVLHAYRQDKNEALVALKNENQRSMV